MNFKYWEKGRKEYEFFINEIPPNSYKIFYYRFPDEMFKFGKYQNNIAIVTSFYFYNNISIKNFTITSHAFEIFYTRDDRDIHEDPTTKHINRDCKVLLQTVSGKLISATYKRENHYIPINNIYNEFINEYQESDISLGMMSHQSNNSKTPNFNVHYSNTAKPSVEKAAGIGNKIPKEGSIEILKESNFVFWLDKFR